LHPERISPLFADLFPLRMCKTVFRDSWLYPKQLSLYCLLWLISASADHIGYITSFCSMIKLLPELKNSSCSHRSIQAFYNVFTREKGKLKICWTSIHNNKSKVYSRTLCLRAFSIFVWFSKIRSCKPNCALRWLHTESGYRLRTGLWPTAVFAHAARTPSPTNTAIRLT